jgi:hypothetical protein
MTEPGAETQRTPAARRAVLVRRPVAEARASGRVRRRETLAPAPTACPRLERSLRTFRRNRVLYGFGWIEISSTSKISIVFGGICGPTPRSP